MSFQNLVSSSECGVSANPLSQVLKHAEGDRSLQQDRSAGSSSANLRSLPGMSSTAMNQQDAAMARRFFEGEQGPGPMPAFNPAQMGAPMNSGLMERPIAGSPWTMDQRPNERSLDQMNMESAWAAEFGGQQMNPQAPMSMQSPNQGNMSEYQQRMVSSGPQFNPYMNNMSAYRMGPNFAMNQPMTSTVSGKGKGKEIDFEAAFAQAAASLEPEQVTAADEVAEQLEKATLEDEEAEPTFKEVWDSLQDSDVPPPQEDMAKWESEFNQLMSAQRDDLDQDYGAAMQKSWEGGVGNYDGSSKSVEGQKFDPNGIPILEKYDFERENRYLQADSGRSFLADAKALLDVNGSLSEAALLLEAAIQKGDLGEGGYEAWVLLGETRNMDEREDAGMKALMEGVRLAEANGTPGPGMLSLAISFTNESYDRGCHSMLLRWLRARHPSLPIPQDTEYAIANHSSWDTHERITELFIKLAREQHSQGIVDPDVQMGLGVLFYVNADYDRAKDCFESAVTIKPRDYLLWNRLGSSLSNGNKPEEALGAYREALSLRPTYTRAIYNVGVACMNIGAHKEAAEHFLSALQLQDSNGGDTSDAVWYTLRRAFLSMERPDLGDLCKPELKTSLEVFRREGFDF